MIHGNLHAIWKVIICGVTEGEAMFTTMILAETIEWVDIVPMVICMLSKPIIPLPNTGMSGIIAGKRVMDELLFFQITIRKDINRAIKQDETFIPIQEVA
jgi:hypothetical protein